jgi:acyl-CoA synthetase (AMP-forming)/AMP-acid ligase II/thioesterase domain-containing protein/acyl carrier protein
VRNANPFHDLLVRVSADHEDVVALRTRTGTVSFAKLLRLVDEGTAGLRTAGIADGVPVAVRLSDSVDGVIELLTVLCSPHPVLPIDIASPPERTARLIEAAGAVAYPGEIGLPSASVPRPVPGTAVLMFTSGSTGEPKAVRQGFAQWMHQITELGRELDIGPGRKVALAMPVSFGGGLDIALAAVGNGATLCVSHPRTDGVGELTASLIEWRPDSLHLTPALLRALLAEPGADDAFATTDIVCTCGEAIGAGDVARLREVNTNVTFTNRSGSTETGNLAFNVFGPDRPLPDGMIPAGRIAAGKAVTVVDDQGLPAAPGTIGTLVVRSPNIAQGYLGSDFPDIGGVREHVLGDRGSVTGDQLHLAGRGDDTVKIRGYRVDVSEVVGAIEAIPEVAEAAVLARHGTGGAELIAYLATAPGVRPPSVAEIRTTLAASLPSWMQPTHVLLVAALPRTERGKVDRTRLPEPAGRPRYVAPVTTTEGLLASIWEDLLRVGDVGRDDDFLSLGGDSLTVVELITRTTATFGTALTPSDLVSAPTLRAVADAVDRRNPPVSGGDVVPLSAVPAADDDRPLVFAFSGAGESALAFGPLARCLGEYRVIGLQPHALEGRGIPDWTVGAAARRFARHILDICPPGPFRFVGHSLGGVIAIEVARLLSAQGHHVEHIVCLDTIFDGPLGTRARMHLPAVVPPRADTEADGDPAGETTAAALWRRRLALLSAGWWRRPAKEQWSLFHDLGRRSALLHRLRPWYGPVTAILADDNPDNPECWYAYAPHCAGVHVVAGDHNAILRHPYVDRTARLVADALTSQVTTR